MRAIVQNSYGSADVLALEEVPVPTIGDTDVLIRVVAASVHVGDWHMMAGLPYLIRLGGLRSPRPRVRGMDVAGRVEAVGAAVTAFRPGQEVFGTCSGSLAELAAARQDALVKPAPLGFEEAACLPVSGCTALQALRDVRSIGADEVVDHTLDDDLARGARGERRTEARHRPDLHPRHGTRGAGAPRCRSRPRQARRRGLIADWPDRAHGPARRRG